MSAIAGVIHFDSRPVEPGQVEAMTAAMIRRGPDGINHWRKGNVALGQCMLRTTPESLQETQPLTNEDEGLVLVMDGRVDNGEDLRRELVGKGTVLRTRADAELVLRAYETWRDDCVHHIVGECAFFVWDARNQSLFGARDGAGTRHFYYAEGKGFFAFASEIKGLLALPMVERRLNETRLLDYLVEEFDRDDEIGTFYQGVLRLPAGHAMRVDAQGVRKWRWWNPGELAPQRYASMAACTEAFMAQLKVVTQCRLRSIKPVGAMLSGGLDSSTIVGLISKQLRGDLREPLRTFSLVQADRDTCPDWPYIRQILEADPWLQPTIIDSAKIDDIWQGWLASIAQADEPFSPFNGLTYGLTYAAGAEAGCGVMLDGMAGDVLFYSFHRTAALIAQHRLWRQVPALLAAYRRHGFKGGAKDMFRALLGEWAPQPIRAMVRQRRDQKAVSEGDLGDLHAQVAKSYLASKREPGYFRGERDRPFADQAAHARNFTTGTISFAHEVYGPLALTRGIEPRSPLSDRRMIEFAIRMPLQAKFSIPWYKHLLRDASFDLLPDPVRWRPTVGGHPGWSFFDRLGQIVENDQPDLWKTAMQSEALKNWRPSMPAPLGDKVTERARILKIGLLSHWLHDGPLIGPSSAV